MKTAARYFNRDSVFYIGRNQDYALGMGGLHGVKESPASTRNLCGRRAEAWDHFLIEPGTLVVALAAYDNWWKNAVNIVE
ncbi:MAG: hypothetical protein ACLU8D_12975 [Enterocloster sp.]